jgi:nitrogen regulatory protein PII
MIKLVVAYVDADQFEAIRNELAEFGIVSMSAAAAGGVSAERFAAPNYKGTAHTQTLAEKLRLECVVEDEYVDRVKDAILHHPGRRSFLYVQAVEAAFPEEFTRPGVPQSAAAV